MVLKREDGEISVIKIIFYIGVGVVAYHFAPEIIDVFIDTGARDVVINELEKL